MLTPNPCGGMVDMVFATLMVTGTVWAWATPAKAAANTNAAHTAVCCRQRRTDGIFILIIILFFAHVQRGFYGFFRDSRDSTPSPQIFKSFSVCHLFSGTRGILAPVTVE